jgi:helicase required for RNAi-mediated heterochromatin assembly 1
MLQDVKTKMPHLFKEINTGRVTTEGFIQVQTIDMYQGDENKYVLISLVRSNGDRKIGFLAEQNRRCVAQSRAKCGMYFVGNVTTFERGCWSKLIKSMRGGKMCRK